MLFDFHTQRWTQFADVDLVPSFFFSRDNRYVYFQDMFEIDTPVYRLNIDNRKVDRIASLQQFKLADVTGYHLVGVTPDGFPVATEYRNNGNVYILDLKLP